MPNVHKDFHGCLSYGLQFLLDYYGPEEMEEYLRRLGRNVYSRLIQDMRARGLQALYDHWHRIMTLEAADFRLQFTESGELLLEVRRCPAISHMQYRGYLICDRFCDATRIANDEICRCAGYVAETEYDQANGRCVQRFRKETR